MSGLRSFLRDARGGSAAEFALILPLFLLFMLGTIDAGRYIWAVNQLEKATQMGARFAAVTDLIPGGSAATGLYNYSFAVSGGVTQGSVVNSTKFPGVYCENTGGSLGCTCKGTCAFSVAVDTTATNAFAAIVAKMQDMYPLITANDVRIDYDWSGLGFSGDPNGPDVAPVITVSLRNMTFQPLTLMLFSGSLPLPSASYSLTMEDGSGTVSN